MHPFSYTGLRLVHDEKVRDAMERARVDADLARNSQRTSWLSLLSSVLRRAPNHGSGGPSIGTAGERV